MSGLVSTIIPVHNRAALLLEAVASVLEQTYRPIEVVIVDDGSTDNTADAADQLAASHLSEVHVCHQSNTGPGLAREAGRKIARGEFIQYLDSDDLLYPEKFEMQVAGLNANPDCGVSYGFTRFRHADGRTETQPWKGSGRRIGSMFPEFLTSRWWDTPTPLYRAAVCNRAGPWTDLPLEEDWEYDCRVAALGIKLHFVEAYVAEVRDHNLHRLSRGTGLDPKRLAARARSHCLIYEHARRAGIDQSEPAMQHFARELFLLARQCGAANLGTESRELFALAKSASGTRRGRGLDFQAYRLATRVFGWPLTGKIACSADRLRK